MVELDVRHDRDLGRELEERAVGLVGLGDEPGALRPRPRWRRRLAAPRSAPIRKPGSSPHSRRQWPTIAAVVVLPCVPVTAISLRSAQTSPSSAPRWMTGTPSSRAAASSGASVGIAVETTSSDARLHVIGRVADRVLDPGSCAASACRRSRRGRSPTPRRRARARRARGRSCPRRRCRRSAGAALARARRASLDFRAAAPRPRAGGVGARKPARGGGHRAQRSRIGQQLGDGAPQALRARAPRPRSPPRRPRPRTSARWWSGDRRSRAGRERGLRACRQPPARTPSRRRAPRPDPRRRARRRAFRRSSRTAGSGCRRPSLIEPLRELAGSRGVRRRAARPTSPAVRRQRRCRECLERALVYRARALAAAEHEHADVPSARCPSRSRAPRAVRVHHRLRHRPARHHIAVSASTVDRKREADAPRKRSKQAIREPEAAVGLAQHERRSAQHGRESHRTGDVAATAEHRVGLAAVRSRRSDLTTPAARAEQARGRREPGGGGRDPRPSDRRSRSRRPARARTRRARASRRSETSAPLARSSSAIASAGTTCPAVPPAAITILGIVHCFRSRVR